MYYNFQIIYNLMDTQPQPLFLKQLISKLKIKDLIKKWKKKVKKSKHRKYVLQQFCTSQKTYIDSLKKLKNKFQLPLAELNILSGQDFQFVFNNLDSIIGLAEQMFSRMEELYTSWDPLTTIISAPLNHLEKFFKIYKDYCKNYVKSSQIILEILKNPKVSELKSSFEPNTIIDYLVKPTQRPFKYPLLIRQYLHNLSPDHKDYDNLDKTKKVYGKLCDELNQSMESQLRMKKMIDLQKVFGDDIFESSRRLKTQFSAYYTDIHCKVFVFNNILMIARVSNRLENFMKIHLNGGSYVIKRQNTENFINRLFICGINHNIHLVFNNLHERNSAYDLLEEIITSLYQQEYNRSEMISKIKMQRETIMINYSTYKKYEWCEQKYYDMKLRISVVGAQQRINKAQEKVTYFVKIQLGTPEEIYQIITVDIEKLKQIESYLYQLYPYLQLPTLDIKNKNIFSDDFKNNFTKFIEFRSLHIESFLNYIFRMQQVCQRPEFILHKLNIHQYIWLYLNKVGVQCGCDACLHTQVFTNMQVYDKELKEHEKQQYPYCVLKAVHIHNSISNSIDITIIKEGSLEKKLLWAFSKMNRINYSLTYRQRYGKKISFFIYVPSFIEEVKMKISNATSHDTVRDIINEICKRKGLETTRDLVLVLRTSKEQFILDDDEYIWSFQKYIRVDKQQNSSRGSIFQNFSKTFDDWSGVNEKQEYRLMLRKLYVFDKKLEEEACEKNLERYQLVLGQLLIRFKNNLLGIPLSDIKVFCALFYGIQEYNTLIYSKKFAFNQEKLKNYLPKSKWNYIGNDFIESVKNIIEKQVSLWDRVTILYRCVVRHFGDKNGWMTYYFEIQNTQPKSLLGGHSHILLGLNKNEIVIVPKNSSVLLLSFSLNQVCYRVSGESLFIDTQKRLFHFRGKNLFFFEKLLKTYNILSEIA